MYAADAAHPNLALQDKLNSIYDLRSGPGIELTLRRAYLDLLTAFDNPERRLPPVIHVAGTNGKGSVIAYLRAMAQEAGMRAHVYTSPHLRRFNERIVVAGEEIGDAALEDLLDEALALNGRNDATFFEITTALALAAFARTPADIALLETGLGGRLDCTNVVEKPAATIITPIGFDHMEFLGTTLPQIAAEKAGIMKPGVPCIIGPQENASVIEVFLRKAEEIGCPLFIHGRDWRAEEQNGAMVFTWHGGAPQRLKLPALTGAHQIGNAGMALAALYAAELPVTQAQQSDALRHVIWPARLQQFPAPASGWELWFDGGHNEACARVLAAQAKRWQEADGKPLHIIIGMMGSKQPEVFIAPLAPYAASITAVAMREPKAFPAQELAARLRSKTAERVGEAIAGLTAGEKPGRILVTGSFYLYDDVAGHFPENAAI